MKILLKPHLIRRIKQLLFLMFLPVTVFAFDKDSVLLRAEEYYRQDDFTRAVAEYQLLIDEGFASAALFYNLGNAYFKNHDIKSAILFFERARRLAPNDEAINANLEHSRSFLFDRIEALPEHFLAVWGKAIRDLTSVRGWAWWSITSFISMLVLGLIFLFVHNISVRRFAFSFGVLCLALSITALSLSYLQKANIQRIDEAIVFAPSVTVKSSPDERGNNLFIIHEGTKVRIEDRIGEWYEVRIADGNKGWMRMSDLEVI